MKDLKSEKSLGRKVRCFRKKAGMSQMDLEVELRASAGMISRIESGKVNPNKETLINIAYALKLTTSEIAALFGIDLSRLNDLEPTLLEIFSTLELNEVLNKVANDLILKMGYIAAALFLVRGDEVKVGIITASHISTKVFQIVTVPMESLSMSLTRDTENLIVRAINENKSFLTDYSYKYLMRLGNTIAPYPVRFSISNEHQYSLADAPTIGHFQ